MRKILFASLIIFNVSLFSNVSEIGYEYVEDKLGLDDC